MAILTKKRNWLVPVLATVVIGGCSGGDSGGSGEPVTAEFRTDAHNTGSPNVGGLPALGGVKWELKLEGAFHASPVLADGTLYFGSEEGRFYAVDAENGGVRWETKAAEGRIRSTAAVYGDTLYFLDDTSAFYALDRSNGKEKWRVQLDDAFAGTGLFDQWDYYIASPAVDDETIYVGSEGTRFYALDRKDGKEKWKVKMENAVHGKAVVDGGTLYVIDRSGGLYALDKETGEQRWFADRPGVVQSGVALRDGVLYYGGRDTYVHAVSAADGTELWKHPSPNGSWVGSSPAASERHVAIGASDSKVVHVFDRSSGSHLMDLAVPSRIFASPVIAGNVVYFGTAYTDAEDTRDALYAFDLDTGDLLWRFEGSRAAILSTPVVDEGVVYAVFRDGSVYALH